MPEHFKVHDQTCPHFITNTVIHWIPVFRKDDYFKILSDSLVYCSENKGLQIHAYVFMPDHFHMICTQIEGRLSDVLRDMKTHTSKVIARTLEMEGRQDWLQAMRNASVNPGGVKVWDDHFHPEQVHTQPFFEQKANYIHNNPVKAGFVDEPYFWKYSSAGFYYKGIESPVPVTPPTW